jgi:hypothetical protein
MDQLEIGSGPPPKLRRNIAMAFNCTQCGTLTSDSEGFYDYPEFCAKCVLKAQEDELKQSPFPASMKYTRCHMCKRQIETKKVLLQSNVALCDINCRKTFFRMIQKQARDQLQTVLISHRDLVECATCHKFTDRHKCFIRRQRHCCSLKCCLNPPEPSCVQDVEQ